MTKRKKKKILLNGGVRGSGDMIRRETNEMKAMNKNKHTDFTHTHTKHNVMHTGMSDAHTNQTHTHTHTHTVVHTIQHVRLKVKKLT